MSCSNFDAMMGYNNQQWMSNALSVSERNWRPKSIDDYLSPYLSFSRIEYNRAWLVFSLLATGDGWRYIDYTKWPCIQGSSILSWNRYPKLAGYLEEAPSFLATSFDRISFPTFSNPFPAPGKTVSLPTTSSGTTSLLSTLKTLSNVSSPIYNFSTTIPTTRYTLPSTNWKTVVDNLFPVARTDPLANTYGFFKVDQAAASPAGSQASGAAVGSQASGPADSHFIGMIKAAVRGDYEKFVEEYEAAWFTAGKLRFDHFQTGRAVEFINSMVKTVPDYGVCEVKKGTKIVDYTGTWKKFKWNDYTSSPTFSIISVLDSANGATYLPWADEGVWYKLERPVASYGKENPELIKEVDEYQPASTKTIHIGPVNMDFPMMHIYTNAAETNTWRTFPLEYGQKNGVVFPMITVTRETMREFLTNYISWKKIDVRLLDYTHVTVNGKNTVYISSNNWYSNRAYDESMATDIGKYFTIVKNPTYVSATGSKFSVDLEFDVEVNVPEYRGSHYYEVLRDVEFVDGRVIKNICRYLEQCELNCYKYIREKMVDYGDVVREIFLGDLLTELDE